jgi:hypothetical protein
MQKSPSNQLLTRPSGTVGNEVPKSPSQQQLNPTVTQSKLTQSHNAHQSMKPQMQQFQQALHNISKSIKNQMAQNSLQQSQQSSQQPNFGKK